MTSYQKAGDWIHLALSELRTALTTFQADDFSIASMNRHRADVSVAHGHIVLYEVEFCIVSWVRCRRQA